VCHRAQEVGELRDLVLLDAVAEAGFEGLLAEAVVEERTAEHHPLTGPTFEQRHSRLEAAEPRHALIEHDDGGVELVGQLQSRLTVGRLSDHDKVLVRQVQADAHDETDVFFVVDQQHPDVGHPRPLLRFRHPTRRYRGRMAGDATERFAALVARQDQPLPVDEALLLIAAHADPGLDIQAQKGRLDDLAAQVEAPTIEGLCDLLFERLGFAGDHSTYYAAENSLLPCVLDRRLGIPLSLSLLTIEVGRRRDIEVEGIGMPGHYLVRLAGEPDRFFDVYDGGRVLDVEGCRELFERVQAGMPWDEKYLRPDVPWARVSRTLSNLAGAYRRAGDREALCWTLELGLLLPSGTDRERRELGLLLGASGRYAEAACVLEGSGTEADAEAALRMRARLN